MVRSSRPIDISNIPGLNLRAADKFVRLAGRFTAEVWVFCDERRVNGKSILDLITLTAACGSRLQIETDGPEADAALDALSQLVIRGFDDLQLPVCSVIPTSPVPSRQTTNDPTAFVTPSAVNNGIGLVSDACSDARHGIRKC
jgi:phosphocarrier protein HPr